MFAYRYSPKFLANDKRRKSPNMTSSERSLLMDLVEEHFRILGSKKTDGSTLQAKNVEWRRIAEQFNAKGLGSVRDSANLRCTWENLKKAGRKAAAETKMQNILAGDDASKRIKLDPILERVIALLQPSIEGVASTSYDMDSQSACAAEEVSVLANGSADGTPVELSFEEADWSEYSMADNSDTVGTSVNVKPEIEVVRSTASTSDEPASTSDEQTVHVSSVQSLAKLKRPTLQEDSAEKLHGLKAKAVAKALEEESREHLWREELYKINLVQEKLKAEILKEQLKQERLKTAKLLSELGE